MCLRPTSVLYRLIALLPVVRRSFTVTGPAFHHASTLEAVRPLNRVQSSEKPWRRRTVTVRALNGTVAGSRSDGQDDSSIGRGSTARQYGLPGMVCCDSPTGSPCCQQRKDLRNRGTLPTITGLIQELDVALSVRSTRCHRRAVVVLEPLPVSVFVGLALYEGVPRTASR